MIPSNDPKIGLVALYPLMSVATLIVLVQEPKLSMLSVFATFQQLITVILNNAMDGPFNYQIIVYLLRRMS